MRRKNTKATYRQNVGAKLRHDHTKSLPQTSSAKRWRAMALCVCARECGEWSREGDHARERKPRRFLDVTVIFSARYVRNPYICKHLSVEYRLPLSPGIWIAAVLSRVPPWMIVLLCPGYSDCHRHLPGTCLNDRRPPSRARGLPPVSPGYLLGWSPSFVPGICIATVLPGYLKHRSPVFPGHVNGHRPLPGSWMIAFLSRVYIRIDALFRVRNVHFLSRVLEWSTSYLGYVIRIAVPPRVYHRIAVLPGYLISPLPVPGYG